MVFYYEESRWFDTIFDIWYFVSDGRKYAKTMSEL